MDFTIVTPSYRQLDFLGGCIASVADQEGVTVEHIVQDAGTEGFAGLVDKMHKRWPDREGYRRLMISEPDQGMYDAINKGLQRGTGEICAYLNCDEQYLPGALEKIRHVFRSHPRKEICYAGFLVVDSQGRLITIQTPVPLVWPHVATSHLPNFSCATFFRRSLLERQQAWFDSSYTACADALWNLERLRAGVQSVRVQDCVGVFSQTGTNRGLAPTGLEERKRIARLAPGWVRIGKPLWVAVHRVLKCMAGGYVPRKTEYFIWRSGEDVSRSRYGPSWAHGVWWERVKL